MRQGQVLETYPSESSNKIHEVRKGADGVVYCTCPGWRFHSKRWCKHLEDYSLRVVEQQQFKDAVKAGSSVDAVTQQVIRELKGDVI